MTRLAKPPRDVIEAAEKLPIDYWQLEDGERSKLLDHMFFVLFRSRRRPEETEQLRKNLARAARAVPTVFIGSTEAHRIQFIEEHAHSMLRESGARSQMRPWAASTERNRPKAPSVRYWDFKPDIRKRLLAQIELAVWYGQGLSRPPSELIEIMLWAVKNTPAKLFNSPEAVRLREACEEWTKKPRPPKRSDRRPVSRSIRTPKGAEISSTAPVFSPPYSVDGKKWQPSSEELADLNERVKSISQHGVECTHDRKEAISQPAISGDRDIAILYRCPDCGTILRE